MSVLRVVPKLLASACLLGFALAAQAAITTITEPFSGTTAAGWTLGQNAVLTAPSPDPAGSGWLQLTADSIGQQGYAYYSQAVPTNAPITVGFDFDLHGTATSPPADGMTFFLADSTVAFAPGGGGGGYGYLNPGLAGGVLAVGLSDGYPSTFVDGIGNAISVRGSSASLAASIANSGALNPTPAGSARGLTPADPNYRHLTIRMTPTSVAGQLSVSVMMQARTSSNTVISNALVSGLPATVHFGFTAGTGANTSVNEVRNFSLASGVADAISVPAGSLPGNFLLMLALGGLGLATFAARRARA